MNPEVPLHIIHHHRPRKMKRKPMLSCLINANWRSAYGVAALWLHRMNELQDLSLLYDVCKAEQVCLLLWNSFSWCERVTLSVGCTRLSSQEKENMYFGISADGAPGGIKRKVKCMSQATRGKQEEFFFFQILIKISAQLSTWRPSLANPTHSVILSPSCLIFLQSAYHSSKLPCLFLIVHLPTL